MKIESKYQIERIATTDTTRRALLNVYVDNQTAVTTDGRAMVIVPCEHEASEDKKQFPAKLLKDVRLAQKQTINNTKSMSIELNGEIKLTHDNGTKLSMPYPDTQFPSNYKQVIPDFSNEKTFKITLDASYLLEIAKAIAAKCGPDSYHVTLEMKDAESPILITTKHSEGKGVLMPVRGLK